MSEKLATPTPTPSQVIFARKSVPAPVQVPAPLVVEPEPVIQPISELPSLVPTSASPMHHIEEHGDNDGVQLTPLTPMEVPVPVLVPMGVEETSSSANNKILSAALTGTLDKSQYRMDGQSSSTVVKDGEPVVQRAVELVARRSVPIKKEAVFNGMRRESEKTLDAAAAANLVKVGVNKEQLSCEHCSLTFNLMETLRRHMKTCPNVPAEQRPASNRGRKRSLSSNKAVASVHLEALAFSSPSHMRTDVGDIGLPLKKRGRGRPLKNPVVVLPHVTLGAPAESPQTDTDRIPPRLLIQRMHTHTKKSGRKKKRLGALRKRVVTVGSKPKPKPNLATSVQKAEKVIETVHAQGSDADADSGLRTPRQRKAPKLFEGMVMEYQVPRGRGSAGRTQDDAKSRSGLLKTTTGSPAPPSVSLKEEAIVLHRDNVGRTQDDAKSQSGLLKTTTDTPASPSVSLKDEATVEPVVNKSNVAVKESTPNEGQSLRSRQPRVRKIPARIADDNVTPTPKIIIKLRSPSQTFPLEGEVDQKEVHRSDITLPSTPISVTQRNRQSAKFLSINTADDRQSAEFRRTTSRRETPVLESQDDNILDQAPPLVKVERVSPTEDTARTETASNKSSMEEPPILQPQPREVEGSSHTFAQSRTSSEKQADTESYSRNSGSVNESLETPPVLKRIKEEAATACKGKLVVVKTELPAPTIEPSAPSMPGLVVMTNGPASRKKGGRRSSHSNNKGKGSQQAGVIPHPQVVPMPVKRARRQSGNSNTTTSSLLQKPDENPSNSSELSYDVQNGHEINSSKMNGLEANQSSFAGMPKLLNQSGVPVQKDSDDSSDDDLSVNSQGRSCGLFKHVVIRYLENKISSTSMMRVRSELMALKQSGNYFKLTKTAPLAAGLMHDVFCQAFGSLESEGQQ